MTGYEGPAHLEWWANPSTCLIRVPVDVTAALDDGARYAAASPELDRQAGDDLRLLIDADPVLALRFENGSVTEVVVEHPGDLSRLLLMLPRDRGGDGFDRTPA